MTTWWAESSSSSSFLNPCVFLNTKAAHGSESVVGVDVHSSPQPWATAAKTSLGALSLHFHCVCVCVLGWHAIETRLFISGCSGQFSLTIKGRLDQDMRRQQTPSLSFLYFPQRWFTIFFADNVLCFYNCRDLIKVTIVVVIQRSSFLPALKQLLFSLNIKLWP